MTRRELSDAQLDAIADERKRCPWCRRVGEAHLREGIHDLRLALYREHPDRIHTTHTSKTPDDELDARGWPKDADEGGIGLPFSSRMHRYLRTNAGRSSKHRWDLGPDPRSRPGMASIYAVSEWCHCSHTSHLRPGYTLSLCAEMLAQIGRLGQEPADLAWHFDLELARVEHMLLGALRKAYQWRVDAEARLSREPGTEEPLPERRPYRPAA